MKSLGPAILLTFGSAFVSAIAPASAAVRYDFQAFSSLPVGIPGDIVSGSFSLTVNDFISGTIFVPASELTSCTATGSVSGTMPCDVQMLENFSFSSAVFFGFFNPQGNASVAYYFTPGVLSKVGTYDSIDLGPAQAARITVSLVGGAVPEPGTWAMMLMGFGAIGGALRHRRQISVRYTRQHGQSTRHV